MPFVTVPELKAQLDHDLDDALLSHQIEAAEAHVTSFIWASLPEPLSPVIALMCASDRGGLPPRHSRGAGSIVDCLNHQTTSLPRPFDCLLCQKAQTMAAFGVPRIEVSLAPPGLAGGWGLRRPAMSSRQ